jgi:hypothetical protein
VNGAAAAQSRTPHASEHLALLAPIPATAVGLGLALSQGVRWTAYAPNLIAMLLGAGLVLAARRFRRETLEAWAPTLAALGISATLLQPGMEGVTRWLSLGGLQLNASAALAPCLLLGLGARAASARTRALAATLTVAVVHVLQPDAGQASALAAGGIALLLARAPTQRFARFSSAMALLCAAALSWLRADPLAPVAHVERVFYLAFEQGPLWVAACAVAVAFLLVGLARPRTWFAVPLAGAAVSYNVASLLVTFVGHFPVPVFGAGFASVLGWYALLATQTDKTPLEERATPLEE